MGRLPQTNTTVSRYLRQQKRVVTRMANATPYALSGTSVVAPGLMKVDERLVAGTPGGSRVELDSAGLRKYAADGTTVQVDLTGDVAAFSGLITGSEIIGGEFKTAATGSRIEIQPTGYVNTSGAEISFSSGHAKEAAPAIVYGQLSTLDDGTYLLSQLNLESAWFTQEAGAYASQASIWLRSEYRASPGTVAPETLVELMGLKINLFAGAIPDGSYGAGTLGKIRLAAPGGLEFNMTDEYLVPNYGGTSKLARRIAIVANDAAKAAYVTEHLATPPDRTAYARTITSWSPLFVWQVDAAAGQQFQSTSDGTTWTVIGGGSGGPLFADPNADRLVFWDDSAGAFAPLTASTGLTLTGTDLTVWAASETVAGRVELATPAETVTGTDAVRAVTPAGVKATIDPWATSSSHLVFVPTAALDTPTSGSATWMTLGNVIVPTWATKADVVYTLNGIYEATTTTNCRAQLRIGSVGGAVDRRIVGPQPSVRQNVPVTDTFTGLTPGSQSVTIRATWTAFATVVRADTSSFATAQFTWRP